MRNKRYSQQKITTEVDKFIGRILTNVVSIDETLDTLNWLYPAIAKPN